MANKFDKILNRYREQDAGGGGGSWGSITGTLSAQTDLQTALNAKPTATLSTDGTLAANSDSNISSQKAVKTYVDAETTRAEAAESTNATAISTETSRAETAETLLAPKASPTFTGTVTVPTTVNATDAAQKSYVDSVAQGLSVKPSAIVGTTAGLPTYTYLAGVITMTSTGTVTIDGHTLALGDVILVQNETTTNAPYNGLYTVTTAGAVGVACVLTRSTSMNSGSEFSGAFVFVESGTVNASAGFVCTNTGSVTVGVTNIAFQQFSGAGEISASTGLSKTGNTLSIDSTVATLSGSQALTNKSYNGNTWTAGTGTLTIAAGKTLTVSNSITLAGTDSTTMTFPTTSATLARTDAAQTFIGVQTGTLFVETPETVTVSSNAGTCSASYFMSNFTNSSASAMTVTLATSGAVDGQTKIVRILDASAVAKGITWVNTENSSITVPGTSNGSTTLPLTVAFIFNGVGGTNKWRCVGSV